DTGRGDEARAHFAVLASDGFASVPRDLSWTASVMMLTELAAAFDDKESAVALVDLVSPFAGQVVVIAAGVGCLGAADSYLGLLAGGLGEAVEAHARFTTGLALEERIAAPILAARTRRWRDALDLG